MPASKRLQQALRMAECKHTFVPHRHKGWVICSRCDKRRHELCDDCDKGYEPRLHTNQTEARKICDAWNDKHPIGTPVIVEMLVGDTEPLRTVTRSIAWVIGGNIPVVSIEGKAGGYMLSLMKVVDAASE